MSWFLRAWSNLRADFQSLQVTFWSLDHKIFFFELVYSRLSKEKPTETVQTLAQEHKSVSNLAVFRILAPLYLGVILGPLNITGTINMLPTLSEDFDVSLSLAGMAVTAYALPLVISQVGTGVLTEVLGPSRTLVLGLLVFSISCLVGTAVTSYTFFLVARAFQGLGSGLALPVSMGMAASQPPPGRTSTAIGGIQAAFAIGLALGPGTGGLFAEHLHWRALYAVLGVAAIVAAANVALSYSGQSHRAGSGSPLAPLKQALTIPAVRMISLAGFLSLLALMGILIFVGVWLQRSGLAGPAMSGLLLSIPGIVGVVVAPLAGLLGDRWGNRRIVIGGIVLFVAGSLGLIVTPGTLAAYPPLLLLIGIGLACMITNVGAIALSLRPELRQAISGVFNGSRFFAAVMAPVALTPVYEEFSIRGVLLVIVATSVLLAFVVRPAERGSDR